MKQQAYLFMFFCLIFSVVLSTNLHKKNQGVAQTLKETLGFKCPFITKIQYPIRLSLNNKIKCLSTDGKECVKGLKTNQQCKDFIRDNKKKIKSKTCTMKEMKTEKHWCQKARKYFFTKWHCQEETGLKQIVRFNPQTKNVECLSKNGISCIKPLHNCYDVLQCPRTMKRMKQISCGRPHIKLWGHQGYTFKYSHWCQQALAFFKYSGKMLFKKQTGLRVSFRLSPRGKVQCVSMLGNGKKCLRNIVSHKALARILGKNRHSFISCGSEMKKSTGKSFPGWCKTAYRIFRGGLSEKKVKQ